MPIATLLLAMAAPVNAAIPAHFYNRPGATPAMLEADRTRCLMIATGPTGKTVEGPALAPPIADPSPGPVARPLARAPQAMASTTEGCLLSQGWRLFALRPAERRTLGNLSRKRRALALSALIGARHPAHGRLVRADNRSLLRAD